MHKNLITSLILFTTFASCVSKEKDAGKSSSITDDIKKDAPVSECFRYADGKDTIILHLIHVGDAITGTLQYDLMQKDRNRGTIQGKMRGNLLVADYQFSSEGMQSIREVVFKKENDHYIEGYGEVAEKNEKVYFRNLDSLQFENNKKLISISCK